LEEYARQTFEEAQTQEGINVQSPPEPIALPNREAYVYSIDSQLGDTINRYIFLSESGNHGYKVGISIQNPGDANYEEMTQAILASLEFL